MKLRNTLFSKITLKNYLFQILLKAYFLLKYIFILKWKYRTFLKWKYTFYFFGTTTHFTPFDHTADSLNFRSIYQKFFANMFFCEKKLKIQISLAGIKKCKIVRIYLKVGLFAINISSRLANSFSMEFHENRFYCGFYKFSPIYVTFLRKKNAKNRFIKKT